MGCAGCAKAILAIFNGLLLALGLVPLIFGILALASDDILTKLIDYIPGSSGIEKIIPDLKELITNGAIYLIILGAVLAGIGFVGFCGACCKVKWMLYLYLGLLIAIVLAEIAVIVVAVAFPETFNSQVVKVMKTSLGRFKYDCTGDVTTGAIDCSQATAHPDSFAWHALQFELKCCGVRNYTDYKEWEHRDVAPNALAPLSCCSGLTSANSSYPPTSAKDRLCVSPGNDPSLYYSQGCFDALFHAIVSNPVVIAVMAGIGVLELILIVMTIIQLRSFSKNKYR